MINQNRLNLLHNNLLEELAKAINKRRVELNKEPISCKEEQVFENLSYIYEEEKEIEFGRETGNSYKYMPKRYKEMVMRLIAPDHSISHQIFTTDTSVSVTAHLFLNYSDDKPIATGKATVSFENTDEKATADMNEYQKKMYAESTAKGLAESKAFQKYGIGAWFTYQFEPEENPDKAFSDLKSKDNISPEIAYTAATPSPVTSVSVKENQNENSEYNISQLSLDSYQDETVDTEDVKNTDTKSSESKEIKKGKEVKKETNSVKSDKTDKTTAPSSASMTFEEAKSRKAEIGKALAKGWTLEETLNSAPANILWMYANADEKGCSPEGKEALLVIARNVPEIAKLFNDKGIAI